MKVPLNAVHLQVYLKAVHLSLYLNAVHLRVYLKAGHLQSKVPDKGHDGVVRQRLLLGHVEQRAFSHWRGNAG